MRLCLASAIGGLAGWVAALLIGWGLLPDANVLTAWGIAFGGGFLGAALAAIAWGRA